MILLVDVFNGSFACLTNTFSAPTAPWELPLLRECYYCSRAPILLPMSPPAPPPQLPAPAPAPAPAPDPQPVPAPAPAPAPGGVVPDVVLQNRHLPVPRLCPH